MAKITKIGIHHAGGTQANPLESTQHLTETQINQAHKARWSDFPSLLNGMFIGYNAIIYPDGLLKQYRYIGEETAAIIGHNRDAFHIMLMGNFTKGVDKPTEAQATTLKNVLKELVNNSVKTIKILPGTEYQFSIEDIYPHRLLSPKGYTECNGSGLPDDWARSLAITKVDTLPTDTTQKAVLSIIDEIMLLIIKLRNILSKPQPTFGSVERDDTNLL